MKVSTRRAPRIVRGSAWISAPTAEVIFALKLEGEFQREVQTPISRGLVFTKVTRDVTEVYGVLVVQDRPVLTPEILRGIHEAIAQVASEQE
jgi:hypothetical protein